MRMPLRERIQKVRKNSATSRVLPLASYGPSAILPQYLLVHTLSHNVRGCRGPRPCATGESTFQSEMVHVSCLSHHVLHSQEKEMNVL